MSTKFRNVLRNLAALVLGTTTSLTAHAGFGDLNMTRGVSRNFRQHRTACT
jgi:hypothetical protein